ncbi:MAG TPA: Na(+)/H(+) antiporter subunit D, partial [Hyphomonas atlantica]|nr:Na(+)/H(+) antiporter subunit D [Hyphomonas atlantica]
WLLIAVGLVALFLPMRRIRQGLTIAAPIAAILLVSLADRNINLLTANALGLEMVLYRVDNL